MFARLKDFLLLSVLFLLPWQTRFIYQAGELNGKFWEYGTLSLYATELLLWGCVLLHILEFFRFQKAADAHGRKKRGVIGLIIITFVVIALVRSPIPEVTQQFLVWLMAVASLAVIIITRKETLRYWWALWAGGVLQAVLGIYQFAVQQVAPNKWLGIAYHSGGISGSGVVETSTGRWLRAYGSWGWPNSFGSYLAIVAVLGLLLYLHQTGWSKRILLVGQSLIAVGLFVSFSRGAWIAFVVGLATCFIVYRKDWKKLLTISIVMFVVVLVWSVSFYSILFTRVQATRQLEVRSISERGNQYGQAVQLLKQNVIFGVGPGLYTHALVTTLKAPTYQPVHNIFVLMLVELGSIAATLLFGALVYWMRWIYRFNPSMLPLVIVFFVAGLLEHFFWSLFPGLLLSGVVIGFSLRKIT